MNKQLLFEKSKNQKFYVNAVFHDGFMFFEMLLKKTLNSISTSNTIYIETKTKKRTKKIHQKRLKKTLKRNRKTLKTAKSLKTRSQIWHLKIFQKQNEIVTKSE
jgi:glycerophosphoryl diester phosphodiesterase